MVTSVTKGGTHKLPRKKFKIVQTYSHDHSLERYGGTLSDGTCTISFSIQLFSGEK
jgi:hypothetical protein